MLLDLFRVICSIKCNLIKVLVDFGQNLDSKFSCNEHSVESYIVLFVEVIAKYIRNCILFD